MDSDGQFDPTEISRLLALYGPDRVVCGYRIRRSDTWVRRFYHKRVLRSRARRASGPRRATSTALSSCFRARSVRDCTPTGRSCPPSCWCVRGESGYRLMDVGVHHYPRTTGRATGANVRVVVRAFRELWQLRTTRRCSTGSNRRREHSGPAASSWGTALAAVAGVAVALARRVRRRAGRRLPGDAAAHRAARPPGLVGRDQLPVDRRPRIPGAPRLSRRVPARVPAAGARGRVHHPRRCHGLVAGQRRCRDGRALVSRSSGARRARPAAANVLGVAARARADGALSHRAVQREHLHRLCCGEPVLRARRTVAQGDRRRRASRARSGSPGSRSSPRLPSSSCAAAGWRPRPDMLLVLSPRSRSRSTRLYMQVHIGDALALLDADRSAVIRPAAHAAVDRIRRDLAHADHRLRRGDAVDLRPRSRLWTPRTGALCSACGPRHGSPDPSRCTAPSRG